MKPATEILLSAAFVLTPEENWTQHTMARDDFDYEVPEYASNAVCFCANGAITEAARAMGYSDGHVVDAMCFARTAVNADSFYDFNDSHQHAKVLAALYKAAELSEAW